MTQMNKSATSHPEAPHYTISARVYYEDTDAGGIIYHANYLKFAERGRTEMLRATGIDHQKLMQDFGIILVVRHIEMDFRASGKLDDLLHIHTTITQIGNTSMVMQQNILRDEKILAEITVTVVAINRDGRAVRIPPQLRQNFVPHSG